MVWDRNAAATQCPENINYKILKPCTTIAVLFNGHNDAVAYISQSASLRACDASCLCFSNSKLSSRGSAKSPVSQAAG